jgi:hypothetical protein
MSFRDGNDDYEAVTVEKVEALKSTAYGLLCSFPELGKQCWVPQSQIHDDSEVFEVGHKGKLVIPRWLAEREGLI